MCQSFMLKLFNINTRSRITILTIAVRVLEMLATRKFCNCQEERYIISIIMSVIFLQTFNVHIKYKFSELNFLETKLPMEEF